VNRYVVLYLATLIVLIPIGFLFRRDLAIDAALGRAVRIFLLRYLRADITVAAQPLDLAGGHGRCELRGTSVTAVSSTTGLMIANWIAPRI
jgi:hypothetical protein